MQPEQMILPAIATLALGTALLVPLRDDRLGKRATVGGSDAPLRPNFAALLGLPARDAEPENELPATEESGFRVEAEAEAESKAEHEHEHERALEATEPHTDAPRVTTAPPDFKAAFETIGGRVRRFFTTPDKPQVVASIAEESEPVLERSFADTLGDLLPITPPSDTTPRVTAPAHEAPQAAPLLVPTNVTVVASVHSAFDRIVPLTRMPLRPQTRDITWPHLAATPQPLLTDVERIAFLTEAARSGNASNEPALLVAYREESDRGRMLALRALRAAGYPSSIAVYIDALHVGSDDERAFAIDALVAADRRDAVTFAFNDRVDALAAQAALAYVGTYARADYVEALAPFVDRARIETLLGLLAGIVE